MRLQRLFFRSTTMVCALMSGGCHQTTAPPATEADVAAAQESARKEVEDARVEARRDVRDAVKQTGGDAKHVEVSKATGSFDVAMAQADGDHKVAIAKCLMLDIALQQSCKQQADTQFHAATDQAKALRVANGGRG
jgi:hypothetical protein